MDVVMDNKPEARYLNAFEVAIHQHFFAAILDLRDKSEFVASHIPGAFYIDLKLPLHNQLQRIGSPNTPLILLLSEQTSFDSVVAQLTDAGYSQLAGVMGGTLADWEVIGLPLTCGDVENIQPQELQTLLSLADGTRPILYDVREPHEFEAGCVPTAQLLPLEKLTVHLDELDKSQPIAVICESGCRSQAAAALLGKHGFYKVYDVLGGTQKWKDDGYPLEKPKVSQSNETTSDKRSRGRKIFCQ